MVERKTTFSFERGREKREDWGEERGGRKESGKENEGMAMGGSGFQVGVFPFPSPK